MSNKVDASSLSVPQFFQLKTERDAFLLSKIRNLISDGALPNFIVVESPKFTIYLSKSRESEDLINRVNNARCQCEGFSYVFSAKVACGFIKIQAE